MRGLARIYDVRMAQFVLKMEKLSHIMGPRGSQDLRSPSPIMAPGVTAFGRHCLHHYSYLFMDVVLLILFDVDILHLNVLKGGIPGFQWVFSLVFTGVTQYQHFVV